MSARNSTIIIATGINIDKNYNNTLALSQADIQGLCSSNAVYSGSDYSFLRTQDRIKVQAPFSQIFNANYCVIINQGVRQFFFIDEVKYIADATTEILVTEDVLTTYKHIGFKTAYIERQHTQNDSIPNYAQEKINFDRYVCNTDDYINVYPTAIVMQYSEIANSNNEYFPPTQIEVANGGAGLVSLTGFEKPLPRMVYEERLAFTPGVDPTRAALNNYHELYVKGGHASSLLGAVLAPNNEYRRLSFNFVDKLDGYTPINKKCLQYPYYYINFSNNRGQSDILKPELFGSGSATFEVVSVGVGQPSSMCYPYTYNNIEKNYNHSISIDYPQLPMVVDSYTNFMGQRGSEVMSGVLGSAITGGIGLVTGNPLAVGMGVAGTVANSLSSLAFKPDNQGDGVIGSTAVNYVNIGINNFRFKIDHFTITAQDAKRLDDYFTAFGYAQNEIQTINTTNPRFHCHYVKTAGGDGVIEGIPHAKADIINNAFAKGITFWDSNDAVGNYNLK